MTIKYISECGNYEVWKESMPTEGSGLIKALRECQDYYLETLVPLLMMMNNQSEHDQGVIAAGIQKLALDAGYYLQPHKKQTAEEKKPRPRSIYAPKPPPPPAPPPKRVLRGLG